MTNHSYFSERRGLKSPLTEAIGARFWKGFLDLVTELLDGELFVERFPVFCPGGGRYACNRSRVEWLINAEVGLSLPLDPDSIPETPKVMDGVEFFARYVSEPQERTPHPYFRHVDLSDFDKNAGYKKYSERVNELFHLCGHPFELRNGSVERLGPDVLDTPLRVTEFNTGDDSLNMLLEDARTRFLDSDPNVRRDSLDKLWDAWERLKTLENQDKKKGAEKLLERAIPDLQIRKEIEAEALLLTDIGNKFRIRHHEGEKQKFLATLMLTTCSIGYSGSCGGSSEEPEELVDLDIREAIILLQALHSSRDCYEYLNNPSRI